MLQPPKLTNNPSFDVMVTETTPLLSFFNPVGAAKNTKFEIEVDTSRDFDSENLVKLETAATGEFVSEVKIPSERPLNDYAQYYWRVRSVHEDKKSDWVTSRFYVGCKSDDNFSGLLRAPVKNIEVSGGANAKNIIDYDDPGLISFWQAPPPGDEECWVKFDLGDQREICRIWILSNFADPSGWLKDFVLQWSSNGEDWHNIPELDIKNNDTFRNIIDFEPVNARYFRLLISDFSGYCAQLNEVILYYRGEPEVPAVANEDYVLIVGNEHNGFTFTDLAKHIESLDLNLKTITVPYYEISLKMVENLSHPPVAIILSGNNADYPNLPMFELNGEFEIIRNCQLPILGICAGHQFLAMAYGYTRARSMGWSDITAVEDQKKWTHTKILRRDDPIFEDIRDDFVAPEVHSWAVVEPGEEFEVIAESTYVQAQKSSRRLIYGEQFHAEINASYNHGRPFIENFLKLAKNRN